MVSVTQYKKLNTYFFHSANDFICIYVSHLLYVLEIQIKKSITQVTSHDEQP